MPMIVTTTSNSMSVNALDRDLHEGRSAMTANVRNPSPSMPHLGAHD